MNTEQLNNQNNKIIKIINKETRTKESNMDAKKKSLQTLLFLKKLK